jgi:hypothetical protein
MEVHFPPNSIPSWYTPRPAGRNPDGLLPDVVTGYFEEEAALSEREAWRGNTRLPVDAITGNYDAFRDEGLSPEAAIAETLDCYPEAGLDAIKAILDYRAAHQFQAQP